MKYWIFLFFFIAPAQAVIVEKILAVVDDEMISLSQIESYQKLLSSSWIYSSILFDVRSKKLLLKNRKKLLDHLVDEIILKNAMPLDFSMNLPSKEEILKEILVNKKTSKKTLSRILKKMNLTLEDYKNMLYNNKLQTHWINMEISSVIEVSDQDINDYYLEKKGRPLFTNYEYVFHQWSFTLSQKGKLLAQMLIKNKDLKSHRPQLKNLTKPQMNKTLSKIIPSLLPGQFSKPVCMNKNCYVFELLNKSFVNTSFPQAQNLREELFKKAFLSRLKNWIKEKRQNAIVKKYI